MRSQDLFKYISPIVLLFISNQAFGAYYEDGIPWRELIIPQIVNTTVFLSILVYLLKNPIKNYFSQKGKAFEEAVEKAQKILTAAEAKKKEINDRLNKLEASYNSDLEKAKKDSAQMKQVGLAEAKKNAEKMVEDAGKSAEYERDRAIRALSEELIKNSILEARSQLEKSSAGDLSTTLRKEFVSKLQAAQL